MALQVGLQGAVIWARHLELCQPDPYALHMASQPGHVQRIRRLGGFAYPGIRSTPLSICHILPSASIAQGQYCATKHECMDSMSAVLSTPFTSGLRAFSQMPWRCSIASYMQLFSWQRSFQDMSEEVKSAQACNLKGPGMDVCHTIYLVEWSARVSRGTAGWCRLQELV